MKAASKKYLLAINVVAVSLRRSGGLAAVNLIWSLIDHADIPTVRTYLPTHAVLKVIDIRKPVKFHRPLHISNFSLKRNVV